MRLRHIEVFHAVYNCGSITAAARFLNVSQPSVSKVLAHAELQLGYALFDRIKGKLIPTREAERLISMVSGVYSSIDELRQVASNLGTTDTGRIRLAVTPAFGIELAPAAVASFCQQHEGARFAVETLHYHQVLRALNQSRIDLGLVFHPSNEAGIKVQTLAAAEFVVVTRRDTGLEEGRPLKLAELAGRPFISLSDRGPLGGVLTQHLKASGVEFTSRVRAETYQMAMAMVAHGGGATIIDEITARSCHYQQLQIAPIDPPLQFNVGLLSKEDQPLSLTTHRFIECLDLTLKQFLDSSASRRDRKVRV